jgi:hypothetical protein
MTEYFLFYMVRKTKAGPTEDRINPDSDDELFEKAVKNVLCRPHDKIKTTKHSRSAHICI